MQPEPADLPFHRQSGLRMSIRLTRLPKHLWAAADFGGEQHPSREESEQDLSSIGTFLLFARPSEKSWREKKTAGRKHPTELGCLASKNWRGGRRLRGL